MKVEVLLFSFEELCTLITSTQKRKSTSLNRLRLVWLKGKGDKGECIEHSWPHSVSTASLQR